MMAGERTARGQGIVYQKRVNGTIYYVEMIQNKRGTLATKTMWKKPSGGARAVQDAGLGLTPKNDPIMTSSYPNIEPIRFNVKTEEAITARRMLPPANTANNSMPITSIYDSTRDELQNLFTQ